MKTVTGYPIKLSHDQVTLCREWAKDDRLWTTQETVNFNLETFARAILGAKTEELEKALTEENRKLHAALSAAVGDLDLCAKILAKQYHAAAGETAQHADLYRAALNGSNFAIAHP